MPLAPPLVAGPPIEEPLAVLGLLLIVGALLAGVAHRSFLSLTALFVLAGLALGEGGLEVLEFDSSPRMCPRASGSSE